MTDEKILQEKARSYAVCFNGECPLHEHCLRWQAGCYVPEHPYSIRCFNPRYEQAGTEHCPGYRSDQPQRVPYGMTRMYDDMPRVLEVTIKKRLIDAFSRVMYYRYRRGERPITPDIAQKISSVCRECGWTAPVVFDRYRDELVW